MNAKQELPFRMVAMDDKRAKAKVKVHLYLLSKETY
jgi:hypothetical protein